MGCKTLAPAPSREHAIEEAKRFAEDGEFLRARNMLKKVLEQNPADFEAQKLMAQVIDQELSRRKEIFETEAPEEIADSDKKAEAQTWYERGSAYLEAGRYEEAMVAAQKAMELDPEDPKISELLDRIRHGAVAEGKQGLLIESQIIHGEVQGRVERYLVQAEAAIEQKRWGAARLAIEKTLMLDPENAKAHRLNDVLKARQKQAA